MPEKPKENEYISLAKAAKLCPYSQDYLSLRARQGKLKAIKLGRNWVTTKEWVEEYMQKSQQFFEKRISKQTEHRDSETTLAQKNRIKVVELGEDEEDKEEVKPESINNKIEVQEILEEEEEEKRKQIKKKKQRKNKAVKKKRTHKIVPNRSPLNKTAVFVPHKTPLSTGLVITFAFLVLIFAGSFLGEGLFYETKNVLEQGASFVVRGLKTAELALQDYWLQPGQASLVALNYQHSVLEETFKIFGEYFQWLGQATIYPLKAIFVH